MKTFLKFFVGVVLLAGLMSGCASNGQPPTPTPVLPTLTVPRVLPTPAAPGASITWRDLQVSMDQAEITDSFITEFGSQRIPSPGQKFLWVHVQVKNMGKNEIDLPAAEHFSALLAKSEFKPTYGHRQDHADYTALDSRLLPEQAVDAWLRFDIPDNANLKDVWFIFLPESSQVGVLPSSPNYPWAEDHPTFAWYCAP